MVSNQTSNQAPLSNDILAKATESIFQEPAGGVMSPGFYNHTNDDNPLLIVDVNASDNTHSANMLHQQQLNQQMSSQSLPKQSSSICNISSPLHAMHDVNAMPDVSKEEGGAKSKVAKSKDGKLAKPKKKSKDSKAKQKQKNNISENSVESNQFLQMSTGQHDFTANSSGVMSSNFPMSSEHFMPDLADSLDDGDNESDINDFSDLIRLHDPKPSDSIPAIAQVQALTDNLRSVASSPDGSLPSLPPSLYTPTESVESTNQVASEQVSVSISNMTEIERLLAVTATVTSNISTTVVAQSLSSTSSSSMSSADLVSSWINTSSITSPMCSTTSSAISLVPELTNISPTISVPISSCTTTTSVSSSYSNVFGFSDNGINTTVVPSVSTTPSVNNKNNLVSSESMISSPAFTTLPYTCSSEKAITVQCSNSTISSVSPVSLTDATSLFNVGSSNGGDLNGLTPMEIIQSIAENVGKEKQEKSPKESKDPSPRISQKKLAKAGKGPPPGNLYHSFKVDESESTENLYPSFKIDESKSPKKIESVKSPKRIESVKSPKRLETTNASKMAEVAKSPKRESTKSPKRDVAKSPKRCEVTKSPKRVDSSKSPKRLGKRDSLPMHGSDLVSSSIVENHTIAHSVGLEDQPTLEMAKPDANSNINAMKKENKKASPRKETHNRTHKVDIEKELKAKTPNNKSEEPQDLSMTNTIVNKNEATASKESNKRRTKSKDRTKNSKGDSEKPEKKSEERYPDEPPKLEREAPFPEEEKQGYSKSKPVKKIEENIFMNAIISDKQDFFGSGPSLFAQSSLSGIPQFTNASLPPPAFGFGASPFFRFPMMNAASGLAPSFQHHMPLFAQPPPLFSNSFGEVPYKFPTHPGMSPRGLSGFRGNAEMGMNTQKDKSEQRSVEAYPKFSLANESESQKSLIFGDSSSSGKAKKKSKKDKRKEKEKEIKHDKVESEPHRNEIGTQSNMLFSNSVNIPTPMIEISSHSLQSIISPPKKSASNEPASEATSTIDIMAASSEVAPTLLESSSFPDKTSEISERGSSKRKKDKKKKKERRKKDKSDSEYEFEIVQHSVLPEEILPSDGKHISSDYAAKPEIESKLGSQAEVVGDACVLQPVTEAECETELNSNGSKTRKSRSRTRKKSNKIEVQESRSEITVPSNIDENSSILAEESDIVDLIPCDDIENFASKDSRKTYSLRGRGTSPKRTIEEVLLEDNITGKKVTGVDEASVTPTKNSSVPDSDEFVTMSKLSPLKQSPKIQEPDDSLLKNSKGGKKGRGRGKPRKEKEILSEEKLPEISKCPEESLLNPESESLADEPANKKLKLKLGNRLGKDSPQSEHSALDPNDIFEELASPASAGKILKTIRAQRKSDTSPPKVNKFGADINVSAGKKGKRGPSPLKKLPKGKSAMKLSATLPTPAKTGPFDVFDFDDEPSEMLPITLKSFSTLSKEQKSNPIEQEPGSPSKQPTLKLKFSKNSSKEKKSKLKESELIDKNLDLNRTMSSEFADSEMSLNTQSNDDTESDVKEKKARKSRKRGKKSKIDPHLEAVAASSVLESTDSEHNQSQESVSEISDNCKSKGKSGRKSKKASLTIEAISSEMVVSTAKKEETNALPSSSEGISLETQKSNTSLSESEGYKSDKESKNKEHIGLEKTIKALHERLKSTSPIRLPPPVLPGLEDLTDMPTVCMTLKEKTSKSKDMPTVCMPLKEKTKSKSRKRTRDSSQSESEALDLTVYDAQSNIKTSETVSEKSVVVTKLSNSEIKLQKTQSEEESNLFSDASIAQTDSQDSDVPMHQTKTIKKGSRSRKRSKDEAKLDHASLADHQLEPPSEPTPAKLMKGDEEIKTSLDVIQENESVTETSLKTKAEKCAVAENINSLDSEKSLPTKSKENKKMRKRTNSNKIKSPPVNADGKNGTAGEDTPIPDTIEFTENDLFDVLDQVEQCPKIDSSATENKSTSSDPTMLVEGGSIKRKKTHNDDDQNNTDGSVL